MLLFWSFVVPPTLAAAAGVVTMIGGTPLTLDQLVCLVTVRLLDPGPSLHTAAITLKHARNSASARQVEDLLLL